MLETHLMMSSLICCLVLILVFHLALTLVLHLALFHVLCLTLLLVLCLSSLMDVTPTFYKNKNFVQIGVHIKMHIKL
jgi:hypothetical protein